MTARKTVLPGFRQHESCRRHDRDIPKWIEYQQIAVAAHDQIRMAIDCQLEEFVVGRIASGGDALGDRHQLGGCQKPRHAFAQRRDRRRDDVRTTSRSCCSVAADFSSPSC